MMILKGLGERFGHIDRSLNPDLEDIQQTYIEAGHRFVVMEAEGEIIGTAALKDEGPGTGRIVRVNVRPDQRRQGIARQLVEYFIQVAADNGYEKILVETNIDWYNAIRLYERCGFVEFDRDDEEVHLCLTL